MNLFKQGGGWEGGTGTREERVRGGRLYYQNWVLLFVLASEYVSMRTPTLSCCFPMGICCITNWYIQPYTTVYNRIQPVYNRI